MREQEKLDQTRRSLEQNGYNNSEQQTKTKNFLENPKTSQKNLLIKA